MTGRKELLLGLNQALKESGNSYKSLSKFLGYTYQTVYRKKMGDLPTSVEDLKAMAEFTGKSIRFIVEGDVNPPESTEAVSKHS